MQKTSWLPSSSATGKTLDSLDDLESSGGANSRPFDQFQGKKTNYSDDIYSTHIDMTQVSREQQMHAAQVERDITGTVTSNRHMAEERN